MGNANKRWSVVNRKSLNERTSFGTRAAARLNKRSTERIFDNIKLAYVR